MAWSIHIDVSQRKPKTWRTSQNLVEQTHRIQWFRLHAPSVHGCTAACKLRRCKCSGQDPCHKVGKGCQPMVRWEKSTESLCRLLFRKKADTYAYTSNRTIVMGKSMIHYQIFGENQHVLLETLGSCKLTVCDGKWSVLIHDLCKKKWWCFTPPSVKRSGSWTHRMDGFKQVIKSGGFLQVSRMHHPVQRNQRQFLVPKQGSSLVSFPSDLCGIVPWLKRGTKQKYDTIAHSFILRRARSGLEFPQHHKYVLTWNWHKKTCFYVTWAPLHWICYLITLVWKNAINFNCRCQYWLAKWVKREHLQVNVAKISDHCFNFDRQMLCLWGEVCRLTDAGITIICRCICFFCIITPNLKI